MTTDEKEARKNIDEYVIPKLIGWSKLFYGSSEAKGHFARRKGDGFLFGTNDKRNHLTRAVAIFIATGDLPNHDKPKKVKRKRTKIKRRRR